MGTDRSSFIDEDYQQLVGEDSVANKSISGTGVSLTGKRQLTWLIVSWLDQYAEFHLVHLLISVR